MGVDSVFEFLYDFTGVDDELDGRKPVRRLVVVSTDGAGVVARFLWIDWILDNKNFAFYKNLKKKLFYL